MVAFGIRSLGAVGDGDAQADAYRTGAGKIVLAFCSIWIEGDPLFGKGWHLIDILILCAGWDFALHDEVFLKVIKPLINLQDL